MRNLSAATLLVMLLASAPPALASAPPNDDINNAVNIASLPYTSPLTDISEASDSDESDPSLPASCYPNAVTDYKPYKTVWYMHTAAQTSVVRVHTVGSDYDTVLAIWHGSPGALTLSGCNDDISGSQQSSLDVWVTEGTTYYIEVGAFSAVEAGSLSLSIETIPHLIFLPLVLGN